MPSIYLGQSGSEIELPKIRALGDLGRISVGQTRQFEKETMADGSPRYNVLSVHPRKWQFKLEALTAAELASLQTLNALAERLHFKNEWESDSWTWVFIESFEPEIDLSISSGSDIFWSLDLTLGEIPG